MSRGGGPAPPFIGGRVLARQGREGVPPQLGLGLGAGLEESNSSSRLVPTPLACFPQFLVLAV